MAAQLAASMALDFVVDAFVGLDGSKYYGTLKNGVPSGLGTCIWPNQCHYDGEWKDGLMHGFGTYVWKTGQRYDGEWKVRGPPRGGHVVCVLTQPPERAVGAPPVQWCSRPAPSDGSYSTA